MGPTCGHSACGQNYIDTGETGCILVECPLCKGKREVIFEVTEPGGKVNNVPLKCVVCDGEGKVTPGRALSYKRQQESWCKCGNPSGDVEYVPDNVSSVCSKHHYVCRDCGKIVQIG